MTPYRRFNALLKKEFVLEFKDKHALGGIVLFVFSTLFIVAISLLEIDPSLWISLFWIIMIFTALSSVLRSFSKESDQRHYYYYTIAHPVDVYLAKAVFNFVLLLGLGIGCICGLSLISSFPVTEIWPFTIAFLLGVIGITFSFSLLGYMSTLASGNTALMAVLGFPLIIPVLIQVVKIGVISCGLLTAESLRSEFMILVALDLIIVAMGIWLFPYLWRK
jgi:heme exporter protein B